MPQPSFWKHCHQYAAGVSAHGISGSAGAVSNCDTPGRLRAALEGCQIVLRPFGLCAAPAPPPALLLRHQLHDLRMPHMHISPWTLCTSCNWVEESRSHLRSEHTDKDTSPTSCNPSALDHAMHQLSTDALPSQNCTVTSPRITQDPAIVLHQIKPARMLHACRNAALVPKDNRSLRCGCRAWVPGMTHVLVSKAQRRLQNRGAGSGWRL